MKAYNRDLLDQHQKKAAEIHYKKLQPIGQLFKEDCKALFSLPFQPFDACRYLCLKADGYGKVRIDERHYYSTSPENANCEVWVAIRAQTVDLFDNKMHVLVQHALMRN